MHKMNSHDIEKLLEEKHKEDLFVSQCKTGASGKGVLILDGWAMKKSWANPCFTGYEIKVSRSDFNGDDKWRGYLDYCNEFYFVCPAGMVKPEEVPDPAGLICVSTTGNVLYKKKKPIYRDLLIPESLYQYVLMVRTKITRDIWHRETKKEFWEKWLADKKVDNRFGYSVGKTLRETIKKEIEDVRYENKQLKDENENYSEIKSYLDSIGVNRKRYHLSKNFVQQRLNELKKIIPDDMSVSLDSLFNCLVRFKEVLADLEKSEKGNEIEEDTE